MFFRVRAEMPVNDAPIQQPITDGIRVTTQAWVLWLASVVTALRLATRSFTVAELPPAKNYSPGTSTFASNGRKGGEGAGAGTGVPIWTDGAKWLTFYDNTEVAA